MYSIVWVVKRLAPSGDSEGSLSAAMFSAVVFSRRRGVQTGSLPFSRAVLIGTGSINLNLYKVYDVAR